MKYTGVFPMVDKNLYLLSLSIIYIFMSWLNVLDVRCLCF